MKGTFEEAGAVEFQEKKYFFFPAGHCEPTASSSKENPAVSVPLELYLTL